HARPGRTMAQVPLDPCDRVGITLHDGFHPPVRQIPDEAGDAFSDRNVLREPAKAHTLDPSADHEPTCNAHVTGTCRLYRSLPEVGALRRDHRDVAIRPGAWH